jgi:hypothetical protein
MIEAFPEPKLPDCTIEELRDRGREHRYYLKLQYDDGRDADIDTLNRWAVNYARHILTEYEQQLMEIAGKIGADEARMLIRERIYEAIADQWPELFDECMRQLELRERRQLALP